MSSYKGQTEGGGKLYLGNDNGIPLFFYEGRYSFDLKKMAEEDYKYSVDMGCDSSDSEYREWALNVKINEYSVSIVRAV